MRQGEANFTMDLFPKIKDYGYFKYRDALQAQAKEADAKLDEIISSNCIEVGQTVPSPINMKTVYDEQAAISAKLGGREVILDVCLSFNSFLIAVYLADTDGGKHAWGDAVYIFNKDRGEVKNQLVDVLLGDEASARKQEEADYNSAAEKQDALDQAAFEADFLKEHGKTYQQHLAEKEGKP